MEYMYKRLSLTEQIQDAWIKWSEYRNSVTEYILKTLPFCENKKIAIYGAGECNDINIQMLLNKGCKITLFDCNVDKVKKAAEEKKYLDKVEIKYINVFDIKNQEYERLEELLACDAAADDIKELLLDILNRECEEKLCIPSEEYGLNICVGLHSQILVKIICLIQLHSYGGDTKDFSRVIHEMNQYMVERFHDELFKKGHGDVIIGYEYGTFSKGKAIEIRNMFEDGRALEVVEKDISRVAGAYETENDIQRRFNNGEIHMADYDYSIWNFLDSKEYLMVFFHII